ncbi:hypothetical protein [uncultured Escherichia sp.]|uniref:hypothetical protein n=1 Tax=uncultured Escherichia sp. TaxID=237777 RepID=UPI0025A0DD9E|nr:hypothetical protein [uncultured Escherichia sp.]
MNSRPMSNITVEKMDVLAYTVTGAERLDPVRVMIENYEPGKGRITVTCYGRAWTGAWFAMGGDTVQDFIKRVSNDYLIGCLAPRLESTIDDDNEANLNFVKQQIIKLRQEREIEAYEAREMWAEAENADDVKANCCDFLVGEKLLNLFGDDPWYAGWPKVPNHEYQYLERVLNAMREGLNELERAVMSTNLKEWLHQTIAELEEERDATPGAVNEDAAMALAAMKLALASLEAESVADVVAWSSPNKERTCDIRMRRHDIKPGSLYTAPPAPEFYKIGDATMRHIFTPTGITDVSDMQAAFDQIETVLAGMWQPAPVSVPDAMDGQGGVCCEVSYADGWNSCRAAMLQGAEHAESPTTMQTAPALDSSPKIAESPTGINQGKSEPVTTANKLPFEQWLSQQTGTIDVECGCVMTEVFFHWLRVAYEAGNYPVIPDGWVLVPIEPTYQMCEAMGLQWESPRFPDRYKAMLAAVKK